MAVALQNSIESALIDCEPGQPGQRGQIEVNNRVAKTLLYGQVRQCVTGKRKPSMSLY